MIPTWLAIVNGVIVAAAAFGFYSIGWRHGRRSR
jgi:hypothetical protein